MPIYEEKLISPLSVRFTQEHIRTTFRDGRLVEASLAEIKARPGSGDYDLVLEAPFPLIEIIRWRPKDLEATHAICGSDCKEEKNSDCTADGGHWFTLDNRRLYCLQRAAAAHWPLRVAAVVEILYADPGAVWRKYDSSTRGRSVTISHSVKDLPISRWDWRREVPSESGDEVACAAADLVKIDDDRLTVDALLDVSDSPRGEALWCCSTPSTAAATSTSEEGSVGHPSSGGATPRGATPPRTQGLQPELGAIATWVAKKQSGRPVCEQIPNCKWYTGPSAGHFDSLDTHKKFRECRTGVLPYGRQPHSASAYDTLAEAAILEIKEQLTLFGNACHIKISQWNQRYRDALGTLRQFLQSRPDLFIVIPGENGRYTIALAESHDETKAWNAWNEDYESMAAWAIEEIREIISAPGSDGRVWVPNWNQRYAACLGSVRQFIESRPDVFRVILTDGSHYVVEMVCEEADEDSCVPGDDPVDLEQASQTLALSAAKEVEEQLKAPGNEGHVRISRWHSRYGYTLGSLRRFLESRPAQFTVSATGDGQFTVASAISNAEMAKTVSDAPAGQSYDAGLDGIAARACAEIEAQLCDPSSHGYVWITKWNERYLRHLGSLRDFLENRPDKFTVIPGTGKGYRVEVIRGGAAPSESVGSRGKPRKSVAQLKWVPTKVSSS
mmetsp:Transcript_31704/g.67414  ORF Transcript_31704/g.67414 Transcript_31704/m.67414 type:complete len:671 (+) Transcript_31704:109-2121(+)